MAGLAAGGARAEEKRCQLQALGEIAAAMDHGQIITQGQVDGKPVRLIVDTGAFGTLLFESDARGLGLALRQTNATAVGVGGVSKIYTARVRTFSIGGLTEHDKDLVVAGQSLGASGVVGAKFLLQADLEFDLGHGAIRFFKARGCTGDEVVYWGEAYAAAPLIASPDDRILVQVRVNGKPIVAQMDTGAGASVLTRDAAALTGVTPTSAGIVSEGRARGLGTAAEQAYAGRFDTFSFGDETIRNAELRISDLFGHAKMRGTGDLIAVPVTDEPGMLLGADFVRSHRIFLALDQHRVYASYQGGPVFYPVRRPAEAKTPAKP
jgi:predicted aspartyl protease